MTEVKILPYRLTKLMVNKMFIVYMLKCIICSMMTEMCHLPPDEFVV